MLPQSIVRRPQLMAAAAALSALLPATAAADHKAATVTHLVSQYIAVDSDGSRYHQVNHLANLVADVRAVVDTEDAGRVKSWGISIGLMDEDGTDIRFPEYGFSKSYPWYDRPRWVDRTERLVVPAVAWDDFVMDRCNALADQLRTQGKDDDEIFGQDRGIELAVVPEISADTTGAGSGNILEEGVTWPAHKKVMVICKKWPLAGFHDGIASEPSIPTKVVNKGLSILEQYGMSGLCKIRLDGWITTNRKNVDVSFRYRNQEGKNSRLWTVNTGESKTATFSHWYEIANNYDPETGMDWAESGFVRIVGVSHDFRTDWAEYTMECVEGGPDELTANIPPRLTMRFVEQGEVRLRDWVCPASLKLVGLLEGRGPFSGYAAFVGQGYISPPRAYSITHGEKVLMGADYALEWDIANPSAPAPIPRLHVRLDFNVTNEDDAIIASLTNRLYVAVCRWQPLDEASPDRHEPGAAPRAVGGLKARERAVEPQVLQMVPRLAPVPARPQPRGQHRLGTKGR